MPCTKSECFFNLGPALVRSKLRTCNINMLGMTWSQFPEITDNFFCVNVNGLWIGPGNNQSTKCLALSGKQVDESITKQKMNLCIFIVDSCRQNPSVLTLHRLCYVPAFLCTSHLLFISCSTPALPYEEELAVIDTDTISGTRPCPRDSRGSQGHPVWERTTGWRLSLDPIWNK